MISFEKKFIFIHIPKTAGSSIVQFFSHIHLETSFGHFDRINENNIQYFQNYFKFAFHRNPWCRMVSLWKYWTEARSEKELIKNKLPKCELFDNFCYNLSTIFNEILGSHQLYHIMNQVDLNGHSEYLSLDFWGRFNYLDEDFKTICNHLNLKYEKLPHLNKTIHHDYRDYYNDDLKKYVGKLFEKDIDTFKYTFNS